MLTMKKRKNNPTETLSPLLHLKPGTEEYKRVEAELIKEICDIDLEDDSIYDTPKNEGKC